MRCVAPLLVVRGASHASLRGASTSSIDSTKAAATAPPSVNMQLLKLKGQLNLQHGGPTHAAANAPQSLAHVTAMNIMSDMSSKLPLWTSAHSVTSSTPHAYWSAQLVEMGRFLHSASVFGASTTTPRVKEALQWLQDHEGDIAQHVSPSALNLVMNNAMVLRDGSTRGVAFALTLLVPLMRNILSRSMARLDGHHAPQRDDEATTRLDIVAPFTLVRQLVDAVTQRPQELSADGEVSTTAMQQVQAAAPQLKELLLMSCTMLLRHCSPRPVPSQQPTAASASGTDVVHMDCYAWNGIMNTMVKLQQNSPNSAANSRSSTIFVSVMETSEVAEMYHVLHDTLVRSLEQPSVETVLMSTAAETTARLHRLVTKPSDLIYLFNNLVVLAQHVSIKALMPIQQLMYLMPDAMKRSTARDVARLCAGLARWRQHLSSGKQLEDHSDDRIIGRVLEVCRTILFRQAQDHLRLTDAVSLISHLSKLRVQTPIDMIELLCDCCLAGQQEMTVASALQLIQGLHRLADWHQTCAQHESLEKWTAFRHGRLVHMMHVVLHRVEAVQNQEGGAAISSSEAFHLVDTFATLNNTTSIAMYRLMRPRLLEAIQQESDGTLSLKEVNQLIVSLGALRKVSTSTLDEEQLVAHAEQERSLLFERSQAGLLDKASVLDIVHFLTYMVSDIAHKLPKQSSSNHKVQLQEEDNEDAEEIMATIPHGVGGGGSGGVSALQLSALRKAVDQVPRCCAVANGPQLGGFARLLARMHRLNVLPVDACVKAATAVVTASVANCASASLSPLVVSKLTPADVTKGPQGTIAVHDVCSMTPLLSLLATQEADGCMALSSDAQRHVWVVALQRVRLLARAFQPRDVRIAAHMMTDLEALFAHPLLSNYAWDAWAALMEAIIATAPKASLSEVSALVASMHAVRRLGDDQDSAAAVASSRQQAEEGEEEDLVDDNDDDSGVVVDPSDAPLSTTIPPALLVKWDVTMNALAKRAAAIVATNAVANGPAVVTDLKWAIRVLKGFANNESSVATAVHVRAFFYAVLPLLRAHAQQIGSVDLSLALHAFAKVGIWNVVAMEPLIQSACDGLAIAPPRQCVALLHTIVRSGFVRPEMVIAVPSREEHGRGPQSRGAKTIASTTACGSNEAMEQVARLLCQRIALELDSTSQSSLGDKELLAVVNATSFFASPPRPLFDMAMRELCRRTCVIPTEEQLQQYPVVPSAKVLALFTMLTHAHKLLAAADQVTLSSRTVSCCLTSRAWRLALLQQPIGRIGTMLDGLMGAYIVAQPPVSGPSELAWGVDEANALHALVTEWLQRHAASWSPGGLAHVLSRVERLSLLCPSVDRCSYAKVLSDAVDAGPLRIHTVGTLCSEGALEMPRLRCPDLWTPAAAAAFTKLLLLNGESRVLDSALPPAANEGAGRGSTHEERLVMQTVALVRSTLIGPVVCVGGAGALHQQIHALSSTLRRSSLECVCWCLRALCHCPDVDGKLSPLLLTVEQLLFERWHADTRDPTSLGLFASLLLDPVAVKRLGCANAMLVRRAPMLLTKIATRAAHRHGIGYSPLVLRELDRCGHSSLVEGERVASDGATV